MQRQGDGSTIGYSSSTRSTRRVLDEANQKWRQKILRVAVLQAVGSHAGGGVDGGTDGGLRGRPLRPGGLSFLLVDPNTSSMVAFVSDLATSVRPERLVVWSRSAGAVASLVLAGAFVDSNPSGLAFAGVVPVSVAAIQALEDNTQDFFIDVSFSDPRINGFRGPMISPSQAAQLLPSLLLPRSLLIADPSLYSSLALSFSFRAVGAVNITVNHNPNATTNRPLLSNQTSLDLASGFTALAAGLPAAFQAMAAGVEDNSENSTPVVSTSLTSFLTSVLPALPALTKALPSVQTGQLLQAGSAALMSTMMAYAGFLPPLNSPRILSALSSALESALSVGS